MIYTSEEWEEERTGEGERTGENLKQHENYGERKKEEGLGEGMNSWEGEIEEREEGCSWRWKNFR